MDGADGLSREAVWPGRLPAAIANICQGEFLPAATMRGLLNLYRTMQRGPLDAKADAPVRRVRSFHNVGLGLGLGLGSAQTPGGDGRR